MSWGPYDDEPTPEPDDQSLAPSWWPKESRYRMDFRPIFEKPGPDDPIIPMPS